MLSKKKCAVGNVTKKQKRKTSKAPKGSGVYSSIKGDNADLFANLCQLYLKPDYKIADVTYGKGVFWRQIDLSLYDFYPSDLKTCPKTPYDFRSLPYEDAYFDVVVLDPPYTHNPGKLLVDANYKNKATTSGMYHKDILRLYIAGMIEALRVLKDEGTLWIKCKDEVESQYQRWSHIELFAAAERLGLYAKDFFILTQKSVPVIQHKCQQHARKNHSYLWIFKKIVLREFKKMNTLNLI